MNSSPFGQGNKQENIFKQRVSEKRLLNVVKEVSTHHRIQASPMFKEAAEHVAKIARGYGLDAKVINYQSDYDTWYLESRTFAEWNVEAATLDLVDPDLRIADYSEEPMSVIQKSFPIDLKGEAVELIYLDKGADPSAYSDIDFNGKFVFSRDWFKAVGWVYEKGALGIVTDFVMETANRTRAQLANILTYTSYWHDPEDEGRRGFVLSPNEGDKLAAICVKKKAAGEKVLVKPYIRSSLSRGSLQDVEITIEGKDDKLVYLAAHLCHPKSSCNDNASGVSATLEAMNVYQNLIREGRIAKPQHTIKLILMPEMTGTYPYLAEHNDYKKVLGAMNLDMVGARQSAVSGPITLTKTPLALPNLNNEIASYALHEAAKEAYSLSGADVAMTNHRIEPYSGGSDHYIYCDPSIDIPCCMLGQWPDLFYHTSGDTIDVIDPKVLKFSCLTALNFIHKLANFTAADLPLIFEELVSNITAEKTRLAKEYLSGKIDKDRFGSLLAKHRDYYLESIKRAERLCEDGDITRIQKAIEDLFAGWFAYYGVSDSYRHFDLCAKVYRRKYIGPIDKINDYRSKGYGKELDEYAKATAEFDMFAMMGIENMVAYYIDGKRTMNEVIREVSLEMGEEHPEAILAFVKTLEALDLIEEVA